jgi:uncharacterized protein (DUF1810 family)
MTNESAITDPFNLMRFEQAQTPVYETVCRELRQGAKASHWMWFIFPQIAGLGRSQMAHTYAIGSRAEARAYYAHLILGARLRECTQILLALQNRTALQIFGSIDAQKFCSSMTLFALATDDPIFEVAICRYFDCVRDLLTTQLLAEL